MWKSSTLTLQKVKFVWILAHSRKVQLWCFFSSLFLSWKWYELEEQRCSWSCFVLGGPAPAGELSKAFAAKAQRSFALVFAMGVLYTYLLMCSELFPKLLSRSLAAWILGVMYWDEVVGSSCCPNHWLLLSYLPCLLCSHTVRFPWFFHNIEDHFPNSGLITLYNIRVESND